MAYILAVLGGLLAAGVFGAEGTLFGLVIGFLLGTTFKQKRQLQQLESKVSELDESYIRLSLALKLSQTLSKTQTPEDLQEGDTSLDQQPDIAMANTESNEDQRIQDFSTTSPLDTTPYDPAPSLASSGTEVTDNLNIQSVQLPEDASFNEAPDKETITPSKTESISNQWSAAPGSNSNTDQNGLIEKLTAQVKDYFTGGNLIVRVGVIVLFFGVGFLLKFAAENSMLPIEFRLAGVAVAGIIMLLLGWRLRNQKQMYALALQGGAVGLLYLTVFASLRLYTVLPATLALGLMLLFVAFSAALALLQNARSLAVLATAGGFLAPVLTSTGEGSHVSLFSYYLMLNGGVLAIAWFRSWRELNLVGFGFTFVIGTLWGFQYYQPSFFASTEPFLIAFFLLYSAIAVLFALRQPPNLKGIVDGTLVFGVPLAAAGLQAMLVKDYQYGLAFSSIALGGFYIVLATVLFRRGGDALRLLSESFLSTGVVFATLAVPFALEGRLSASFWALEGAAMVWVGLRQNRLTPRLFGCALQLLGALLYIEDMQRINWDLPLLNSLFLGTTIIAFSGLFSGFYINRHKEKVHALEKHLPILMLVWGILWWLFGVIREIDDFASNSSEWAWLLAVLALTSVVAQVLKSRLSWSHLQWVGLSLLPALCLVALGVLVDEPHPFVGWVASGWIVALAAQYWILHHYHDQQALWFRLSHGLSYWLLTFLITIEAAWQLDQLIEGSSTWEAIPFGLVPMLMMLFLFTLGKRLTWPVARYTELYSFLVIAPIAAYLLIWTLFANAVYPGSPWPIQFIPVINPLDLTLLFSILIMFKWWQHSKEQLQAKGVTQQIYLAITGGVLFLLLNGIVARTVHHWTGIAFDLHALFESQTFQASIAVLWGSIGLICMLSGSRLKYRTLWLVGAGMMVLVVAKLFLVDLSNSGTVARIVSFIGVGLLLLVVGYFSPAPPRGQNTQQVKADEHPEEAEV